jgi:mono/diheme cytochrome c family protein
VPDNPGHDDPIVRQSLSAPLLIASLLLMLSLGWALYDEFVGLRPWKAYQEDFIRIYGAYLEKATATQTEQEKALRDSSAFQRLEQATKEAEDAVAPQVGEIDKEIDIIDRRITILRDLFASARGEVTALVYTAETASSEAARTRILQHVDEVRRGPFVAEGLPTPDGRLETQKYDYDELEGEYNRLKDRKAYLTTERVKLLENATALRKQRDAYIQDNLVGLTAQQMRGLQRKTQQLKIEIKQIHVGSTDLVDRCESCHLGIREPITLTAADLDGRREFVSHPDPELLKIHDPERFGCSPCHGGNGRATSSVVKAHGRNKFWLWPLYYSENYEAGCESCHARDMVLEHADVLNHGKELFRSRGCISCHRVEDFDDEHERLLSTRQQIGQLQRDKHQKELEIEHKNKQGDQAATNEEAQRLYAEAENIRMGLSGIDARVEQLRLRARDLMREEKKTGPNLKEVRLKLNRNWIPYWIGHTRDFRPTTRMPQFRLEEDQIKAIAAFIWQSGIEGRLPPVSRGDPDRGRDLFFKRGCLGCHSIGGGERPVGGSFAANLSRVGEKANYEYLVRWITNPRQRYRPYCPLEKRDLTPDDYAKHGLPFVFDLQNSRCPNDGEELLVEQMTVMPSLRLSPQAVRDIATFLLTQRQQAPNQYAAADYMEDPELFDRGKDLVKHYGCAGCHEIAGLEEEGRIGTDLTAEGSKPVDRLDFALLTEEAKRGVLPDGAPSPRGSWYDHKGFFEQKLANPATFDQGKIKVPLEKLRMPKPNVTPDDIAALSTFLLGSVEPGYGFPTDYLYRPEDRRRDIQEGWWIVTKYNCMGCHEVRIGQKSVLMTLPQYQTPEGKDKLPPLLVGVGARLNPKWLTQFLTNPALSDTDLHRNGVRNYLDLRMPTFYFTVGEVQKLVRFFSALASQAEPYIPPVLEPLTDRERTMARALFTHPAAPCLRCHATGDPVHDRQAIAPNFLLAKERLKPDWTRRWILDPASLIPGTAMPSGLFRHEGDRWVFSGPHPAVLRDYKGDHADLLVRYMFQITPEEQRRLVRQLAAAPTAGARRVVESD